MLKLDSFPTITPPPRSSLKLDDRPAILIVDHSLVDRRLAGRLIERHGEWRAAYARDGAEAVALMSQSQPAALLTEMQMLVANGQSLVEETRQRFPQVPVLIMTGPGSKDVALTALRSGASSLVSKRRLLVDLLPAVCQVIASSRTKADRRRAMSGLAESTSVFVLDNDPSLVAPFVAMTRDDLLAVGICDEYEVMRTGIALEESLLNAILHGNLEVSSDLKLEDERLFHQLAAERRKTPPFCRRRVTVTKRLTPKQAEFTIADEGPGFDVAKLPDPDDPEVTLRPFGRGLMLMRTFMDEVTYNAVGNAVTMIKRRKL
jgi:CheY-like chemotaxis protein